MSERRLPEAPEHFLRIACLTGLVLILVWGLGTAAEEPPSDTSLQSRVEARLESLRDELIALRRDLHRHPEVSGREQRTARVVAEFLRGHGLDVRTGVGGHGVVARLDGGRAGPVVAFRADMDAVTSRAPDPVPFASVYPGVRHICGHDIHTTVGLALAASLAAVREELPGSVLFLFQPAEEAGTGARAMLDDGVLDEISLRAVFAFHTSPLPVGVVGSPEGAALPGRDRVFVRLTGEGVSAARLDRAAKAVREAIESLGTVKPEEATRTVEGDFLLVRASVGAPDGERRIVRGTLTTASQSVRQDSNRKIRQSVERLASRDVGAGISFALDYQERVISGIDNDSALEQALRPVISAVLGEDGLLPTRGSTPMFSEDFGFFQDEAPGVMYWLGVSNPDKGTVGMPHSPNYVADEESIFVGARAMTAVILEVLTGGPAADVPRPSGSSKDR